MPSSRDVLLQMYRHMLRCRSFSHYAERSFKEGRVPTSPHLTAGQEAVAVGLAAALRPEDRYAGSHRCQHHLIARGASLRGLMAETLGRVGGVNRGRAGEFDLYDPSTGFVAPITSIIGDHTALATGVAFALKQAGKGAISVCIFGDGGASQGLFFESMHLGALWRLPVLFVIENNGYAGSTPQARATFGDLAKRGASFDIPGYSFDGMDAPAVYAGAEQVVSEVRARSFPAVIEFKTYRYSGHTVSDPAVYRPKEELEQWRRRDPIPSLERRLVGDRQATEAELRDIRASVDEEARDAYEFACSSPFPSFEEVSEHVYA